MKDLEILKIDNSEDNFYKNGKTNPVNETLVQNPPDTTTAPTDFWQAISKIIALQKQVPPLLPISQSGNLSLSFAQERLWFLQQLEVDNPFYNQPTILRLTGAIEGEAIAQSLNEIVRRHEILRSRFVTVNGQPIQEILPPQPITLPVTDLREIPSDRQSSLVLGAIAEEIRRPFDLSQTPLWRITLLQLSEAEYLLIFVIHHIIFDGWSEGVFCRELGILYEAFCADKPSPLPEIIIQYADFADWQRQWLRGEILESQLSYWNQQLGGRLPVLELPLDRPRSSVQTHRGARQSLTLSKHLSEAIANLCRQQGVTLFMTLLAAFKTLLYHYTRQDDILIGSPIANRNRVELEGMIGFFVNTLVLRTDLSGSPTFRELLHRVRRVALDAYSHQDLPFEKLVEALQPERNTARHPIFQVWFNLLNFAHNRQELSEVKIETISPPTVGSKFDLTLSAGELEEGILLEFTYNIDLFEEATIARMLGHLQNLLAEIVCDCDRSISALSLLTETEREKAIADFNEADLSEEF